MADLRDCLQTAMDAQMVDITRARATQEVFGELVERYELSMPAAAAQAAAQVDVKKLLKEQVMRKRHVVLNQLTRMRANADMIATSANPAGTIKSLLEYAEGRGDAVLSVRSRKDGLRRQLLGMMSGILSKHARNIVGEVRNKAALKNIVRELHGEKTGDASAAQLADAWRATAERARSLFNAFGGDIGKLADWGLPHTHDKRRIKNAGFNAWREAIEPALDWSRITDRTTDAPFAKTAGGRPDPVTANRMLRDIYDNLTTDGWDDRIPSMAPGGGGKALYNRRADARLLHFTSADAWLKYNDAFGTTNPFDAMIGHIEGMSRDIALMQVLGPNPAAGLDHMIQTATRKATLAGDEKLKTRVADAGKRARGMLMQLNGQASVAEREGIARFMAGTRAVLAAAQLGSAILSSVTDLFTVGMAAKSMGMNPANMLGQSIKLMASKGERDLAASMGYVADTLADTAAGAARYYNDIFAAEITDRLTGFVMRAQGLAFWTDMHRLSVQLSFAAELGRHAGQPMDALPPRLSALLRSRGMTDADWAELSDPTRMFRPKPGAVFLSPQHWRTEALAGGMDTARAENLALNIQAIVEEQLELAVPTRSVEASAALYGETKPGSFSGEAMRAIGVYKSYPMSLMVGQYRRMMAQGSPLARAQYGATFLAGTTLLGATAVQLKELVKGNDPRPMDDQKFWGAAFLQGGGVGILGDLLASETSRTGGGLAETLGGPVVGLGSDLAGAVFSNAKRAITGESTFIGRDVANLARRYTPGSSIFYARTALDRMVWDQLQDFLDPEARSQWNRRAKQQRRDYGNASWWRKGELLPDRAPDLSTIAGDDR
jgi:hypothetical protein